MAPRVFLFLLGLVGFSSAMVISHRGSSIGSIAERFQKEHKFPDFKEPTEKEWIAMLNKAYLQKNTTYASNQTGEYADSDGFNGLWNATTYVYYISEDNQLGRRISSRRYEKLGDSVIATGTESYSLFTEIKDKFPSYGAAGIGFTASFVVQNNSTYIPIANSYTLAEGSGALVNGSVLFTSLTMALVNVSDSYSVSESEVVGEIDLRNTTGKVEGKFASNSLPLSSSDGKQLYIHKDPVSLTQMIRDIKASSPDISVTNGVFEGEFTVGDKGTYSSNSSSATQSLTKGSFVNATSSMTGTYKKADETNLGTSVPFYHTLSEVLTTDLF